MRLVEMIVEANEEVTRKNNFRIERIKAFYEKAFSEELRTALEQEGISVSFGYGKADFKRIQNRKAKVMSISINEMLGTVCIGGNIHSISPFVFIRAGSKKLEREFLRAVNETLGPFE